MAQERKKEPAGGVRSCIPARAVDERVAWFAERQAGLVARRQLIRAGIGRRAIERRVSSGRLLVIHPGVYAVGHRTDAVAARHRAALLYVGGDSAISHLTAAAEHQIWLPAPVVVDVTTPRRLPSRPGIRIHSRRIDPAEIRTIAGIPITSPSQTLFDLGTMLGTHRLAKVANEAFVLQLIEIDDLHVTLARNERRKGSAAFRRLLAVLDPNGHRIRSPLEGRLHTFLRTRGYPPWESNVRLRIGGETVEPDVLWRAQRVIAEADGRDPHLAPLTFASDRRRDRRLRVEGWQPVRVTSVDLDERPDELDDDLRALLGLPLRQ